MTTTIHLIPHSHTDPGWLSTYDEYYKKDVGKILGSVLHELQADANLTFVWSETCYFARYFESLHPNEQQNVRDLVTSGQLEFVGGGWVQHDEALTTVGGILGSMTEGHIWLEQNFGVRPVVGWQIDPFGHSASSAALLGQMGLAGVVVNRMHYRLKERWRSFRNLEFLWESVPNLGWKDVLTHVLHTHYSSPMGFDLEGARLSAPELADKARQFHQFAVRRAQDYRCAWTRHEPPLTTSSSHERPPRPCATSSQEPACDGASRRRLPLAARRISV